MPPLLTISQLERAGLQPATFALDAGECVSLTGPSGAGKTLLLRALADLDPNTGEVTLDGEARDEIPAPLWRRKVAYLPAESGWWSDHVREHCPDWSATQPLLARLGLPDDVGAWPVARLSTGERQRIAFARMLALAPRVMLLDEPTSGLDENATRAVEELVREHLHAGGAALWVSHDMAQALRVSTRGLSIDAGRVREVAPA